MINELIEQIGGRERLLEIIVTGPDASGAEQKLMARALLSVLDVQENSTIRKRKALLWLERQQMAHPGMNEVRYAIEILTSPPAVSTPDGWKLVPLKAFPSQWAAGQKAFDAAGINKIDPVYHAMVEAAPAPGDKK